ncbi:hypothetical protein G6514_002645 [Epicoccum nigrum]|nr:hypothetical protein G6514_002645 [Epicoccum nigrum]
MRDSTDHDKIAPKTQSITQKDQTDPMNNRTSHVSDSEKDSDADSDADLDFTSYTPNITSLRSRMRPALSVEDLDEEGSADAGDRLRTNPTPYRKRSARQAVEPDTEADIKADTGADIDDDSFDDIDDSDESDIEDSDPDSVLKTKRNRTERRPTRNITFTIPSDVKVYNVSDIENLSSNFPRVD